MNPLKPIDQQVVVVVGASSGIGRITALRFAERGAKVIPAGRALPPLLSLVDEIRQKGGEATAIQADVIDYNQVKSLADRAVEIYGRIDTWVHLPAVSVYAPFSETRPDEFRQIIEVNLLGQVYGAMAALPHIKEEGRGALIHISSVEAKRSLPFHSAYAASKHGIVGFLDTLRLEVEHEGLPISITNVMPASINTPFFDKSLTRLGVKPRPIPPVYEPEVVADTILYAAEHPVRDIFAGGAGRGLVLTQKFSPRLADKILGGTGFFAQRTNEPKTDEAPNNLYQHLEGLDRIYGSFGQEAKSASVYTWLETRPALRLGLTIAALGAVVLAPSLILFSSRRGRRFARRQTAWKKIKEFLPDK